ncbi:MAG: GNA1162 family protein [Nitrospinota bacterium]
MRIRKNFNVLLLSLFLFLFAGCTKTYLHFGGHEDLDQERIKKIAVLPFMNETSRRLAGEVVTNIFNYGVLKVGFFKVEEKGNVEQFLFQEKIRDVSRIEKRKLRRLGHRLNVDAVYIGTVEEFAGGSKGLRLATPKIAFRVKLVETKTGKILWAAHNRASGDDYVKIFDVGRIRTAEQLMKRVVVSTLQSTFEEAEIPGNP